MVRRVLGLIVTGMWFVTAGCAPKTQAPPVTTDFSCRIQANYGDMAVTGELTRHSAGTLELTFSQPDTLDGLTALWDGETVTLQMYGLSFSVDPASVPESALGEELIAVLDAALRGESQGRQENGNMVFEGQGKNGAYTLICNGESGYPVSLTVPSLPLYAEFSEFE